MSRLRRVVGCVIPALATGIAAWSYGFNAGLLVAVAVAATVIAMVE